MANKRFRKSLLKEDTATKAFNRGLSMVVNHPLFAPIVHHVWIGRYMHNACPDHGYAIITNNSSIHVNPHKLATPENWFYILAHCLLHFGLEHHLASEVNHREWNVACDWVVTRLIKNMKLGKAPEDLEIPLKEYSNTEEILYSEICRVGIPKDLDRCGTAGPRAMDIVFEDKVWPRDVDWKGCLAEGLRAAVKIALNIAAGGIDEVQGMPSPKTSVSNRAKEWFTSSYPLLGSLAASFTVIESPLLCQRMDIRVAAVDSENRELYINSHAMLDEYECRFVMAHEMLHVGLRHETRRQGRDPYLWNIACDYVINGWLVEMGVGEFPKIGALYDPQLKGQSAESVYDRIVTDMRRYRKLATLRGIGLGDMLGGSKPDWWRAGEGLELDEFYRRCLGQGLIYHEEQGRGLLPAGLIEEIQALSHPPVSWDVELAKWFDDHFAPIEKRRTYGRLSRRQSATPDIPRPRWVPVEGAEDGRTFGVVLDTSGSMDRKMLAKALGAISSYSLSRDVPAVRVVFCDAVAYDQGYMPPEVIAERVKIKGRGGTILQPGINLLEKAEDFPKDGPIMIITDGMCDRLTIRRNHAFLIPAGAHLPFMPKGKVFRMK